MATRALSIGAPALATPAALAPVNDNGFPVTAWTDDARAKLLLASCVAPPPKGEWAGTRYVHHEEVFWRYTGYRAEALEAIRTAHGERVHADYMQHGDAAYPAFAAWCRQPSATDAIDAALSASAREG